ncbi:MAG: pseudaminic acid cytidylyltransferase [Bacteroidales bacterium]|nr:pseudaminic acid cytidylyltransferase [Bacteroidales bacterium]
MKNLAIIPARGGSKRIPGKNTRDFLGKPIIAYSIELAKNSGLFSEIMVSTDCEKTKLIAENYGAVVPFFRSDENSNDFATLSDVVEEVKTVYQQKGIIYDNICLILPTAPLITMENLIKGYKILLEKKADSVRPLAQFSYPIQRAVRMCDGKISMLNPEYQKSRSQDLEPAYHDAGQFYWMKFEGGLKGNNKFGFVIPDIQVQDIDNQSDWEMTEIKYKLLNKK